ncbi:transcriptional regulator, LacI family [Faunimonas pinastri]|uniref:Transcriptional regulator, LacI family n=1 Tax=Faunimonas pinastri TaxID=1855383 RepID=A0A1H9K4S0_9HYPH|nr:LacI family DNA-binding transcriptional regulator [Faunimonas pinastri]SEQ94079.1 transcriptional regulator, LacI family [Faunimonas pinastri]
MNPTIQQVAEAAGVSRSTVSRAFTRPDMLNPETVALVRDVAARLGYVPSQVARALSTGRFGNIALLVPDVGNPFFPPLIRAVEKQADLSGACVFLGNSDENPERENVLLKRLSGQVDGFILASSRLSDAEIRAHAARRPVVLVNRDIAGLGRVLIDSAQGVGDAIRHLHELGHRRIAYVSGPSASWSNQQRWSAASRGARDLGLDLALIEGEQPSFEGGASAARLAVDTRVTAAIAFDDSMAHGLLAGFSAAGVDVPGTISVIGCDDVLGARTYPPLTTISSGADDAGRLATDMLMGLLGGSQAGETLRLPTTLIVRATTAIARQGS